MASPSDFAKYPRFPSDVPVAQVSRISLAKLLSRDPAESSLFYESCRTTGFLLLDMQDHEDGRRLLNGTQSLRRIAEDFFSLEEEEKAKYSYKPDGSISGYKASGIGKVDKTGSLDRSEIYNVSEDDLLGLLTEFPAPLPISRNRGALRSYAVVARSIVNVLLAHLNTHLHLAPGTLESLHDPKLATGSQIRMLRFTPQPKGDRRTSLGNHTDGGSITVLFNTIGGLQILPPGFDDIEENWRFVKPEPNCAIVNLGDSMTQFTNGLLRSNIHRVTYAPGDQAKEVRYSMGFFVKPKLTALMRPLGGSNVIPPMKEGEADSAVSVKEWTSRKVAAFRSHGVDFACSKGGVQSDAI